MKDSWKKISVRTAVISLSVLALLYYGVVFAAEWRYQAGKKQQAQGELRKALELYAEAGAILPERAEYHRAAAKVGRTLYRQGQASLRDLYRSLHEARLAKKLNPKYPYSDYELAESLFYLEAAGQNPPESPEKYYRQAVKTDPDNPLFLAGLIKWLIYKGKPEKALPLFYHLAELSPQDIPRFGPFLLKSKQALEEAGEKFRKNPETRFHFIRFLLTENPALAEQECIRAPEEEASPRLIILHAQILSRLGRREEAIEILQKAVKQWPQENQLLFHLGRLLEKKRDYEAALKVYQQIENSPSPSPRVLGDIARMAKALGKYELASRYYHRALANVKDEMPWQKKFIYMELGAIARKQNRLREALDYYQKAEKYAPDDKRLKKTINKLQFELKKQEFELHAPP